MVLKLESEKRAEIRSNILRNADRSEVLDARTEANEDLQCWICSPSVEIAE